MRFKADIYTISILGDFHYLLSSISSSANDTRHSFSDKYSKLILRSIFSYAYYNHPEAFAKQDHLGNGMVQKKKKWIRRIIYISTCVCECGWYLGGFNKRGNFDIWNNIFPKWHSHFKILLADGISSSNFFLCLLHTDASYSFTVITLGL